MARVGDFQGLSQQHGRVVVNDEGKPQIAGRGGKTLAVLTGRYRAENNKAKAAFVQTLKTAYGTKVASEVEAQLGMGNGQPLRTRQVRQLLDKYVAIQRQFTPLQKGDVNFMLERAGIKAARGLNVRPELLAVLSNDIGTAPTEPSAIRGYNEFLDKIVLATDEQLRTLVAACLDDADPQSQKVTDTVAAIRNGCPNRVTGTGDVIINGKTYGNPVELGKGANGTATKYTAADGKTLVLKTVKLGGLMDDAEVLEKARNEVKVHRYANGGVGVGSENVAQLLAPLRMPDGTIGIAMEYCRFGDAKDLFAKDGAIDKAVVSGVISAKSAKLMKLSLTADALRGTSYLHTQRNMAHMDLKPENILLTADGRGVIGDFGEGFTTMAQIVDGARGTAVYQDPKHFEDPAEGEQRLGDVANDTYSAGVMVYQMLTGSMAFFDADGMFGPINDRQQWFETHQGLAEGQYATGDVELDKLVNGLTNREKSQRITCEEALQSPVFADLKRGPVEIPEVKKLLPMLLRRDQLVKCRQRRARRPKFESTSALATVDNALRQLELAIG